MPILEFLRPRIIAKTPAYLVVYKPPYLHSAPLREGGEGTLLDFAAGICPEVLVPMGRKPCEGGLLHRLDFETRGLLLIARCQKAMENLMLQQDAGLFVKFYRAFSGGVKKSLPGFPPPPKIGAFTEEGTAFIESAFRSWGKGRKAVRPLPRAGGKEESLYRTEILSCSSLEGGTLFYLSLARGYRHQIRCHLAWIGYPILNDAPYGGVLFDGIASVGKAPLALAACGIAFDDPDSGRRMDYRLSGPEGGYCFSSFLTSPAR